MASIARHITIAVRLISLLLILPFLKQISFLGPVENFTLPSFGAIITTALHKTDRSKNSFICLFSMITHRDGRSGHNLASASSYVVPTNPVVPFCFTKGLNN